MFDSDYSSDVPLSKILDQLIIDDEEPTIIVNMLRLHEDDCDKVILESIYGSRLFQLDFIMKCTFDELKFLMKVLKKNDTLFNNCAAYAVWQILTCKSQKADKLKWEQKSMLQKLIPKFRKHPYRFGKGVFIRQFDEALSRYCTNGTLLKHVPEWPVESLTEYFENSECSLFGRRMCQYDVFSVLAPEKKYAMLMSIPEAAWYAEDLYVQILDSDESIDVKEVALSKHKEYSYEYVEDSFVGECLELSSYSRLKMKATLLGKFELRTVVLELLRRDRLDVLEAWVKHDKDDLDLNLNVSSLVMHLVEQKRKKEEEDESKRVHQEAL